MALTDKVLIQWFGPLTVGGGAAFRKIPDHGRSPLNIDVERLTNDKRMANGTMRRYAVAKKRTFSWSYELLPSRNDIAGGLQTVDGGLSGSEIQTFHNINDGAFTMRLTYTDTTAAEDVTVMITDFSKEVRKRGKVELWDMSITVTEV